MTGWDGWEETAVAVGRTVKKSVRSPIEASASVGNNGRALPSQVRVVSQAKRDGSATAAQQKQKQKQQRDGSVEPQSGLSGGGGGQELTWLLTDSREQVEGSVGGAAVQRCSGASTARSKGPVRWVVVGVSQFE
jgi:hypothetical protein